MKIRKLHQDGFHVVELLIVLAVTGIIGFVGYKVYNDNKDKSANNAESSSESDSDSDKFVEWSLSGDTWEPMGTAPECDEPLSIGTPIDMSLATSVLLPGQMRGTDFKPHGGIAIDNVTTNDVDIRTVMDGYLYRGSRYTQDGTLQYMFDFMNSCGVMFRLDHLATLTDEFMKYADQLPEPKADDSRTTRFSDPVFIKKGTLVATAAGISNPLNLFFDLGVYDLRQPNEASKTAIYKTDQKRIEDKEQSFYAVCWFDLLPDQERAIVEKLPTRGSQSGTKEGTSDYCD